MVVNASSIPAESLGVLAPLAGLFKWLNLALGGIFGIYVILLLIRWYFERRKLIIQKQILEQLRILTELSGRKQQDAYKEIVDTAKNNNWIKRLGGKIKNGATSFNFKGSGSKKPKGNLKLRKEDQS